jgi:imidazolonepropionase-like amidohydrolase
MMSAVSVLALRNATLIPAPSDGARRSTTLTLANGVVRRIEPDERFGPAPGVEEIDLAGAVVTAGFWNAHVHLIEPAWRGVRRAPAVQLQTALDDLFNSRGFTSAVDLGSNPFETRVLQRRIESGELAGPRIRSAGTGLYPKRGLPFYTRDELNWLEKAYTPTPAGRVGATFAFHRNRWEGAEVVKLFTGSYVEPTTVKPMQPAVARAAARLAHRRGMPVFAHTSDRVGLQVALDAGVDVIAHVPDTTEGTGPLLREAASRGTWLVPTLDMFAQTVTRDPAYLEPIYDSLALFQEAGGRLLFGTDVGYLPDHATEGELAALRDCGLGVQQVLAMLTTNPAQELGGPAEVGTVTEGAPADLVVLGSTTLTDPLELADVSMTIRAGRVSWRR